MSKAIKYILVCMVIFFSMEINSDCPAGTCAGRKTSNGARV